MKTVLDEWSKETNPIAYSDFLFKQNEDLRKQIERLQDENKKLKEQIDSANKLIKWCMRLGWSGNQEEDDFDRYCEKWGVK